jgi:hypothetical protein
MYLDMLLLYLDAEQDEYTKKVKATYNLGRMKYFVTLYKILTKLCYFDF